MSAPMKKMLIIVSIVFGLVFGWYGIKKFFFFWYMSHYQPPAITVSASTAYPKIWQDYLTSVGTLKAINGVDITAEIPGIVKEIHFNSGQFVNQGDLLILLDSNVEQAELKNNQAQLKLDQINFDRNKILAKKNVIPQSTLDASAAQFEQSEAKVESAEAKIKQKTITAPFSGKIGIRQIDIGSYISAGTLMVSLQALDPLYVEFNLPEQYLSNLYLQQPIDVAVDVQGQKVIHGTITAINSKVNQTTRNILVQATIPNRELQLYPGMFASVRIWLRHKENVLTIPQTAISYSLHGDSVFIIKADKKDSKHPVFHAYRQYVQISGRRNDEAAVTKGLETGDVVVSSGQLKLQNGTPVIIDNSVEL